MTTTAAAARTHIEFDDLLDVNPANDRFRDSPDDPVAGMALVKQIAASIARRLPRHVERDELIALGALGWAEARVRFDASRGVPFGGFAAIRVRGAILDGLRQSDTLSRRDRKRARTEDGPAAPRVVSQPAELEAAIAAVVTAEFNASEILAQQEMIDELREAMEKLTERERHVIQRYYFADVPMRTIGEELGVTESRVSQIINSAIGRLRSRLGIAVLPRKEQARPAKRAGSDVVEERRVGALK